MTSRAVRELALSAAYGALTGLRSLSGPAFVSRRIARNGAKNGLARSLGREPVQRGLGLLATGEMVADKTRAIPDRTSPGPLAGRAALGALVGYVVSRAAGRGPRIAAALLGAGAAAGTAVAAYHLRRRAAERLPVPDPLLGAAEDVVVLGVGAMLGAPSRW